MFNLISLELVDQAMNRTMPPGFQSGEPLVYGVDPAWLGTDRSAIMARRGLSARVVAVTRGLDTVRLSELVARRADEERPDAIFVDQTGVGAGVADQLRRTSHIVTGVSFAQTPHEPERFRNKRAELWWQMREWLEKGPVLEQNADLRDDLIKPEYYLTGSGKIQLESKDEMRKRGLASPDLADALALTFTMPVRRRDGSPAVVTVARPDTPYEWMERSTEWEHWEH